MSLMLTAGRASSLMSLKVLDSPRTFCVHGGQRVRAPVPRSLSRWLQASRPFAGLLQTTDSPGWRQIGRSKKVERPILNLRHNVMKITIQYFEGCPHWNVAQKRLKNVLRDVGRDDVEVDLEVIDSPEAAERAQF